MRYLLLIIALVAVGCIEAGHEIKSEQISQIVKGKTTETELIKMFGEPQTTSTNSQGERMLVWSHMHEDVMMMYLGIYGGQMKNQTLMVTIGPDGVVKNFQTSESQTPNGWKQ
jgi:outer membrane protein assembly factor BamE (lipoprotein component of BamABCDE complex)